MSKWKRVAEYRNYKLHSHNRPPVNVSRSRKVVALAKLAFLAVIFFLIGSFLLLPVFAFNLPSPDKVVRREGFSTKIMDRNGKILYEIFADKNRTPVEFKDIPDDLKHATVAIEDKNFYQHQGFDPLGILRGFSRLFTRGRAQGGSTLTQQLVKNVILNSERTVWRKINEFILAIQIERKYSKDDILRMYLNEAPYGGTAWGVGAATELYFDKPINQLSLAQCAFLAGLPQRPSVYSPHSSTPEAYKDRTKQVLRRMEEDGYISKEQHDQALKDLEHLAFKAKGADFKAPHFVQYIQNILENRYGENVVEQGGLRVTTTLDLDLQEKAQTIVSDEIAKVEQYHITNGAAVVLNSQTGEILAMVGSKDFNAKNYDGQVNVTTALRQPGSSIKPFTYATAFKKGYTPATLIMDTPTSFNAGAGQPAYEPGNYDGKFRGPIQLRYALANSVNITAVKMLALVGVKDMLTTAYDLGLSSLQPTKENMSRFGLSVTLGGGEVRLLELTAGYGAFMNEGFRVNPAGILKVEDINGKILEENHPQKAQRILTPEQAFLIADVLSDNEARSAVFGLNSQLNIPGRQVAVKTGTTNDKRDNWTIGGTSQLVVGVWVGNNDNSPMKQVASGVTGASPIWRKILMTSLEGKPALPFNQPGGIVTAAVDTISGYAAHEGFPSRIEKFIDGTQPGDDPVHVKLKVCKSDGQLATPSDLAAGNYDEKEFFVFKENDPTAASGGPNKWQEGINSWLNGQSDSKYHPPTGYCNTQNPVNVEFINPTEHASNLPNRFTVEFKADSTSDITQMILEVDGHAMRTFDKPPYKQEVEMSPGVHTLKVKAKDAGGHESERIITIGVHTNWDANLISTIPTPAI